MYSHIWGELLDNHLRELGYLAEMANIKNSVSTDTSRLHIDIRGIYI